jgi:hypothetical protein
MGKNFLLTVLLCLLTINIASAQEPLSFFPHNVGDRWDYDYWNGSFTEFYSTSLTRDSVGIDSSKYLFYDNQNEPKYKVDTSYNVFRRPYIHGNNYLIYKLFADSGEVWFNPSMAEWVWIARVDTQIVFSNLTTIKVFQYGPVHPDSTPTPYVLRERWLASGFGLIYEWDEPWFFYSLKGCIVEGDTFGIITSVESVKDVVPAGFLLKQNYPNPFNPGTTIEFILPQAAEINLSIYDILGRKVAILFEGLKGAGVYKHGKEFFINCFIMSFDYYYYECTRTFELLPT